jgi:ubiquinone/menaquinone biosynthesis C-methylase UbiE
LDPLAAYLAISDRERDGGRAAAEAASVVAAGGVHDGARLLDAGSGQGWHAIALARRHAVVGIDPALPLLEAGRQRAARLHPERRPLLVAARSSAIPLDEASVDLAFSIHSSLGYGTTDEDRASLLELRRVLRPGARLVVQVLSPEGASRALPRVSTSSDGATVLYEPAFDERTRRLSERQSVALPGGTTGEFSFAVRTYSVEELAALVREAGFVRPRGFGSLELAPWRPGDPAVVMARNRL